MSLSFSETTGLISANRGQDNEQNALSAPKQQGLSGSTSLSVSSFSSSKLVTLVKEPLSLASVSMLHCVLSEAVEQFESARGRLPMDMRLNNALERIRAARGDLVSAALEN